MIQNLSQLKKAIKAGVRFEIIDHCRIECIGEIRRVTLANTQGLYSVVDGQPDHAISKGNDGRGAILTWENAGSWEFRDGLCTQYFTHEAHTAENVAISFRILEEAA